MKRRDISINIYDHHACKRERCKKLTGTNFLSTGEVISAYLLQNCSRRVGMWIDEERRFLSSRRPSLSVVDIFYTETHFHNESDESEEVN